MIRVGAHPHFWSIARDDYGWLTPALPRLYRDMLRAQLAPLLRRSGVDRKWHDTAAGLTSGRPAADHQWIFGKTAAAFYAIE